ncbi:MAG: helix-turn-helix domain-containing protein, partial [bacterium]
LLLQVRRLYDKFTHGNSDVVLLTKNGNSSLVEQFKSLLEKNISSNEENRHARSVSFYAKHLSVHPNYLNAVVKRVTGKTALHFIHEQIINSAETLLLQTNLSVKEVAYQLSFNEPAHFGNFFKKYTQLTPADFREQSHR